MKPRIGIKDIATKAGVSKGTVDRVLHNRGNVSPTARAKVAAAMKELDYQPNVIASALASKNAKKIAVVIPNPDEDPFWRHPHKGILKAAKALRDYRVVLDFFVFRDADRQHFSSQCNKVLEGNYHGVLISPSFLQEGEQVLQKFEEQQLPYVQINTFLDRGSEYFLAYIGQDSYASGILAAKLLSFGISEDASVMILHLEKEAYNAKHLIDKEKGFESFFIERLEKQPNIVRGSYGDVFDKAGLTAYIEQELKAHSSVKGIFVTTSKAFHIIPILQQLGRSDIKLVGFDLIDNNLKYLYQNQLHFLINQNPQKQGFLGIMNLFNYLVLKKDIKHLQMLPLDVVMKENVQYYLEDKTKELHLIF